ncbi:hypothetical protein Mapa_009567 [Marchantia paleacea]|nr:hypothetical protein Mapa_009567 [Marchantia paleacea]
MKSGLFGTIRLVVRRITMVPAERMSEFLYYVRMSVFVCSCWVMAGQVHGLSPDGETLLEIKSSLVDIPDNMSNWLATDASPCSWYGVSCLEDGLSVRSLNLSAHYANLSGPISPSLGKLSSLQELDLSYNSLYGLLPKELGNCSELRYMRFDSNQLISGNIPSEFGRLSKLQTLSLSNLDLTGKIPDEFGNLSSLLRLAVHNNNLTGPVPSSFGNLQQLSVIHLYNNSISGSLPPTLGNCRGLVMLHILGNQLSGSIPPTFGQLENLVHLDVTSNQLTGPIPPELGNCTSLKNVLLGFNRLSGSIPEQLGRLQNAEFLHLHRNRLTGQIPSPLGNMSSLKNFSAGDNVFTGQIPSALGTLGNMLYLSLNLNQLTGSIPGELGNCSKLGFIFFAENRLSGSIPPQLGRLKLLSTLRLRNNTLTGEIPPEIGNCSNLELIELHFNNLAGIIPVEIAKLPRLKGVRIYSNLITGAIPSDLGLHSNLTHVIIRYNNMSGNIPAGLCSFGTLEWLDLSYNMFHGEFPGEVARCPRLHRLRINSNRLAGPIPKEIGQNTALDYFDASDNELTGSIPSELGSCKNLSAILLSRNNLTGTIPSSLSELPLLVNIDLSSNQLTGSIPSELQKLPKLSMVDFSINRLSGEIPHGLSNATGLRGLNLNDNRLTGLHNFWGSLRNLLGLQLAGNMFSGPIPSDIGMLVSLQIILDLSRNQFSGPIPSELGKLQLLETLDLSVNNLSGEIPSNLDTMLSLRSVNISYNNFTGSLPQSWAKIVTADSVFGNPGLCSLYQNCAAGSAPPTSAGEGHASMLIPAVIGALAATCAALLAMVAIVKFESRRRRELLDKMQEDSEGKVEIWSKDLRYRELTLRAIRDATSELSSAYIVHQSANSTVYRAALRSGPVVAIKVLHGDLYDRMEKYYKMEIETIGKIKHRNLVRMIAFCEWKKLRFLVVEFLNNGSLDEVLHQKHGEGLRTWDSRYKVALGVAHGLEYLHFDCNPPILHRDIKSSNVLLDDDFVPHISDFGIAKLQDNSEPHGTTSKLVGSHGYIAPECGYYLQLNEKVDVYSYGVVLLELLTGKHPLDPSFPEGMTIVTWVQTHISEARDFYELLDKQLLASDDSNEVKEMLLVSQVAVLCTKNVPSERPTMRDVVMMLQHVRGPLISPRACLGSSHGYEKSDFTLEYREII